MGGESSETPKLYYVIYEQPLTVGVQQPLFLYKSCLGKVSELKCEALSGEPLDPLKNWPGPNNRLGLLPLALIITVELSISPFSDGAPMPQAHIIVRS